MSKIEETKQKIKKILVLELNKSMNLKMEESKKEKLEKLQKKWLYGEDFILDFLKMMVSLYRINQKMLQKRQEFLKKLQMIIFFKLGVEKNMALILIRIKMKEQEL